MINKKICDKFNDVLFKIENHPAVPSIIYPFNYLLWYSLQEVCKNGYAKWINQDGIKINYNPKNYKKYKSEFDKELKKYDENDPMKKYVSIYVPYKDYYGYKWKADHVEYWGDICFCVYQSNNFKKYYDYKNWQKYSGPECSALSYEELVIKICNLFFKYYGKWDIKDFYTDEEKENHKKEKPFFINRKTKDGFGYYIDRNPKYIDINSAEINRRWLKWFVTTNYCKKNWKNEFDKLLK